MGGDQRDDSTDLRGREPATRPGAPSQSLTVEYAGELHQVSARLTFGRSADIELDSNRQLHRLVGEFSLREDGYWLRNLGSHLFVAYVADDGTRVDLAPGASLPILHSSGHVRVAAGPTRYEMRFQQSWNPALGGATLADVTGATTEFQVVLTPREVDFLVAFAQPVLESSNRPLPSYREVAAMWSVADKTLDNTLQTVKRKLRNARLSRDEPLESMVRTVVAHSLITLADLDWARLGSTEPRPAATGPRFSPID